MLTMHSHVYSALMALMFEYYDFLVFFIEGFDKKIRTIRLTQSLKICNAHLEAML